MVLWYSGDRQGLYASYVKYFIFYRVGFFTSLLLTYYNKVEFIHLEVRAT